ncbi:hypothetical protein [Treponema phagedenis]|uniref:hypothetical protein n=1 Tax=Treponema phagedenis TaxID=162 RepID=UPI001CA45B54|nr:hypothetical protein [Treponema phagedenis]
MAYCISKYRQNTRPLAGSVSACFGGFQCPAAMVQLCPYLQSIAALPFADGTGNAET